MEQKFENKAVNEIVLSPMNNVQLAKLYNVGIKTFRNWIAPFKEEIGEKRGRFYTVKQLQTILEKLGIPGANFKV